MVVGELRHGQLAIIDRIKETVRLSEGLNEGGALTDAAKARALDCLGRFGQRLKNMHASSVRIAATSPLRRASDSAVFLKDAERVLGHPIEVISGAEEARLIYRGVTESLPRNDGMRLVLDIGGGSTELILGQGDKPRALESLPVGCVSVTERFFPNGRIDANSFRDARLTVRLDLRPVKAFFRGSADVEAIGTSGTIISTEQVAREISIIESNDLSPDVVEKLIDRVLGFASIAELSLPGLSERRAQVWPGGLAILVELLEVLRVERLKVSDGALREGLLYDLLGRLRHEDARDRTVDAFARRFNTDQTQGARVADTALYLLEQCKGPWEIENPLLSDLLQWSARLHEIGLDISHDEFQKHGAYIVENADLPGFPRTEQALLAFTVETQRGPVDLAMANKLPSTRQDVAWRIAVLHRLAVLLNRSRSARKLPKIDVMVSGAEMKLRFADGWLAANPLSVADLKREQQYLQAIKIELLFE